MFKWAMLSLCLFAAINFWIRPTFPMIAQHLPAVSLWGAIGLSAIVMALSLVLGKDK